MEEYRNCFEDYEISNLGNLRKKLKTGDYKIVNGSILNRGYKYLQINRNKKRTNMLFHHMVCKAFIGDRPENMVIDHIDRNSLNNNVNNLRYITQKENCRNTDRYITDIPDDIENRKYHLDKRYRENNKEYCKQRNKEYYEKNKVSIMEKEKLKRVDLECSLCKKVRNISYSNYNFLKRNDLQKNKCKKCSAILNLQIK